LIIAVFFCDVFLYISFFLGIFKTYQIDDSDICALAQLPCSTYVYLDRSIAFSCSLLLLSTIKADENVFMEIAPFSYQSFDDEGLEKLDNLCNLKKSVLRCFDKNPPQFNNKCLFEKYGINETIYVRKEVANRLDYDAKIRELNDDECKKRLIESDILKNSQKTNRKSTRRTMEEGDWVMNIFTVESTTTPITTESTTTTITTTTAIATLPIFNFEDFFTEESTTSISRLKQTTVSTRRGFQAPTTPVKSLINNRLTTRATTTLRPVNGRPVGTTARALARPTTRRPVG
jgi:hypothetical protein